MLRIRHVAGRGGPRADDSLRDFVRRFDELLARTPAHLPVEGADRVSATDLTAAVTCVVDIHGDFVDVRIDGGWWHSLGPRGIAPAILDALGAAQEKAMLAMALLRRHRRPIPSSPSADLFGVGRMPPGPPRDPAAEWAAAEAKVQRGYALMEQADRFVALRDSPQPRTVSGPRGLFHLTMVGFTITGCDVNQHGLVASDADRLADDARTALRQATREQDPAHWFATERTRI